MAANCKTWIKGEEEFLKNAQNYVYLTNKKNRSHLKSALNWDKFFYSAQFILIMLTSITTVLAAVEDQLKDRLPNYILPTISGLATLISSLLGVLKPQDRQFAHLDSARKFKVLMLRLVSCEDMEEYKKVRTDIQDQLLNAPCVYPYREKTTSQCDKDLRWSKRRATKRQRKEELWCRKMWEVNPLLKIRLYKDQMIWNDYRDGKITGDRVDELLKEKKAPKVVSETTQTTPSLSESNQTTPELSQPNHTPYDMIEDSKRNAKVDDERRYYMVREPISVRETRIYMDSTMETSAREGESGRFATVVSPTVREGGFAARPELRTAVPTKGQRSQSNDNPTAIVHVDTSRQLPRQNADRVKTPSNNSDQEMEMGEIIGGASSNDDGVEKSRTEDDLFYQTSL